MTDITTQPPPTGGFALVEPVARDLTARIAAEQYAKGLAEYGTPLMAGNGRDALMDAMTEANDLTRYVTQAMLERDRMVERHESLLDRIDIAEREADRLRTALSAAILSMECQGIVTDHDTDQPREVYQILREAVEAERKDLDQKS
jgi:hypothetical protein